MVTDLASMLLGPTPAPPAPPSAPIQAPKTVNDLEALVVSLASVAKDLAAAVKAVQSVSQQQAAALKSEQAQPKPEAPPPPQPVVEVVPPTVPTVAERSNPGVVGRDTGVVLKDPAKDEPIKVIASPKGETDQEAVTRVAAHHPGAIVIKEGAK
jgi:hypothetical protein